MAKINIPMCSSAHPFGHPRRPGRSPLPTLTVPGPGQLENMLCLKTDHSGAAKGFFVPTLAQPLQNAGLKPGKFDGTTPVLCRFGASLWRVLMLIFSPVPTVKTWENLPSNVMFVISSEAQSGTIVNPGP